MAVNPDRVKKAYDAISTGDLRTLQLMVRAGVPADFSNPDGSRSLLSHAARCGQQEAFQWLVDNGADATFRESWSWRKQTASLLECACGTIGSAAIVSWLLANTEVEDVDLGRALLSVDAKSTNAISLGTELIAAGADVNFSDDSNETAMYQAVCESAEEFAMLLLKAGASPSLRSKSPYRDKFSRKTAYEVAKLNGLARFCAECLRLFPALGAKGPKTPKPKSAVDCWAIIDRHLKTHDVRLPEGLTDTRQRVSQEFSLDAGLLSQGTDSLIESWATHNGSNQVGIFCMPDDIAYLFMSVEDAAKARRMLIEVESIDSPSKPSLWANRIPIAENGAGDYLVIDLGSETTCPVSRFSHETTRFRKAAKTFLALLQTAAVEILQGSLAYDRDSNALA